MKISMKSALAVLMIAGVLSVSSISCGYKLGNYKPSLLPSLIAFSSDRDQSVHIYTIKPDGTDIKSTSSDNQTFDGLPAWSPDGTKIAFTSNEADDWDIWTMNEDGSERKRITSLREWDGLASWSPDGSKIAFSGERHDQSGQVSFEIFTVNADGTDVKQLTGGLKRETSYEGTDEQVQGHEHEGSLIWNSVPVWSPDGSKILFASNRDGDGTVPLLYIMNADGSDQKKFGFPFEIDGTDPDWSPVTNQIVFVRGTAAKGDIWVIDAGHPFPSMTAKKITDNIDNNCSPVWSPDGKQIAFVSDKYGNDDIFIMDADGNSVRRVTYDSSNERNPTWR